MRWRSFGVRLGRPCAPVRRIERDPCWRETVHRSASGIGDGLDRVDSCSLAGPKRAGERSAAGFGRRLRRPSSVCGRAGDLARRRRGCRAIVQPGGSVYGDEDVICRVSGCSGDDTIAKRHF